MHGVRDIPQNETEDQTNTNFVSRRPDREILRNSGNTWTLPSDEDTADSSECANSYDEVGVQRSRNHVETKNEATRGEPNSDYQQGSVTAPPIESAKIHVPIGVHATWDPQK